MKKTKNLIINFRHNPDITDKEMIEQLKVLHKQHPDVFLSPKEFKKHLKRKNASSHTR